jgi:hypothetical protein
MYCDSKIVGTLLDIIADNIRQFIPLIFNNSVIFNIFIKNIVLQLSESLSLHSRAELNIYCYIQKMLNILFYMLTNF